MRILNLKINEKRHSLFNDVLLTNINFTDKFLITSLDNSKGKTSLIRFILYSLGFKVPSTKGFNMSKYTTKIEIENGDVFTVFRDDEKFSLVYADGEIIKFRLENEVEREKAIATIFRISNSQIVKNLLGVFYLDQEKGWTLLNRGKIIGQNSFYIEKYILGLKDLDELPISAQIEGLEKEIDRYSAIQDVYKLEFDVNKEKCVFEQQDLFSNWLTEKNLVQFDLNSLDKQINELNAILNDNESLARIIDSYKLVIDHGGEEFVLSHDKVKNFNPNQSILKAQVRMLKIERAELIKKLNSINLHISNNNMLVMMNDIADDVVKEVKKIPIDEIKLKCLIESKKKEQRVLHKKEKQLIKDSASDVTQMMRDSFNKFAQELGVLHRINDEKDYLFTRNLKSFSGAILHKLSLSFKLAYVEVFYKVLGVKLPIIIDSPGSGEVKIKNAKVMISAINKYFKEHQIIVASVYDELKESFDKAIIIDERLMNKKEY